MSSAARKNPETETPHDPDTGEVYEDAPRPRRPPLTEAERAERDRFVVERAQLRRAEIAALSALDPACETDDDPPVTWRRPAKMGAEPTGLLVDRLRVSGRALPGRRLVLAPRYYDGAGPNGGEAHHAATAFVMFRDSAGNLRRTAGTQIRRGEGRIIAAALIAWEDHPSTQTTQQPVTMPADNARLAPGTAFSKGRIYRLLCALAVLWLGALG